MYIADVHRRSFSLTDHKMSKLQGSELRRIGDMLGYLDSTLSTSLWYEASVLGSETLHSKRIYIASMFQFGRQKILK